MLEVEGLAKSYGSLDVFDQVTFDVGRGERLLILGLGVADRQACCAHPREGERRSRRGSRATSTTT